MRTIGSLYCISGISTSAPNPLDVLQIGEPARHQLRLVPQLEGLPRHLGIHNGGMVLSRPPLHRQIPLEPATMDKRVVTQWDKEALEAAHYIKRVCFIPINTAKQRLLRGW